MKLITDPSDSEVSEPPRSPIERPTYVAASPPWLTLLLLRELLLLGADLEVRASVAATRRRNRCRRRIHTRTTKTATPTTNALPTTVALIKMARSISSSLHRKEGKAIVKHFEVHRDITRGTTCWRRHHHC